MAAVTFDKTGAGSGGFGPLLGNGPRKVITGTFAFDSSYPTGGESITDIFNRFRECQGILMESPLTSAGTGKHVVIDMTNKKALLYDNAAAPAQVLNATDQSGATGLSWVAWGI